MERGWILAGVVLCSCGGGKSGNSGSGCENNADCPAGAVCSGGDCLVLCSNDLACQAGEACLDGICKPCAACRLAPDVTAIDATGSPDANPNNPNRLRQSLVLFGTNLEGIAVSMSDTGGLYNNVPLPVCGTPTATQTEVELPAALDAEDIYTLTIANQAGACTTTVQLLRGEIGPAGTYTAGSGILINSSTLSVDFGSAATQAATGNHTHSNYLPAAGGTLTGDLLLATGAHLGIGAQSLPALLHVQGSRARNVNNDPTGGMLLASGLTLASTADAIVDNNTAASAWHTDTATANNSWLRIDLGVGNAREYVQARIYAASAGYAGRYDIEFSDDGSTWNKARTGFLPSALGWNGAAWNSAGAHRYWRLLLTNTPGGGPWLNELEMYDRAPGSALAAHDDGPLDVDTVRAQNAAKAWVSFDGQAVIIKDGFGVANVIRVSTGVYKITWSTPFADSNYVVTGVCNALGFNGATLSIEHNGSGDTQITPTSIAVGCRQYDNGATNSSLVHVIAYGRQ